MMRIRALVYCFATFIGLAPVAAFCDEADTSSAAALQRYLGNLPAVGELVGAENAATFAWVRTLAGRSSIWIAEGTGRTARERWAYREDDGIPLSQLKLSPDGRYLVYVRGSWPNAQGEINNSLDAPDAPERALWVLDTHGETPPRRVAGGSTPALHAPRISPDSRTLTYARGKEVWLFALSSGDAERAFTIRGSVRALAWSPDGQRIAFVSERGTHSFVGVFELATRRVTYLNPGLDRDRAPAWSPDGRWLAFIRTREEVQTYRFSARREGIPWSIMAAEMPSGSVRTVWTAQPGPGSYFSGLAKSLSSGLGPPVESLDLMWAAGQQLVFPWEKTGWRQLYRISLDGATATPVTSGAGEVTTARISRDGRTIFFQANRQQQERFDLWRVPLEGGAIESIWTDGMPYDEPAVTLPDGRVVFIGETARTPRQIMVRQERGVARPLISTAIPGAFPAAEMAQPEVVELKADDGVVTRGLLFRPTTPSKDKRPALVWAHGGPSDIALPGVSKYDARWLQSAVLSGYIVLAVNYRAGIGYGLNFRTAPDQGGGGGSDVRDAIAAGRYLCAMQSEVDPHRIGIFGQSYGGYLTTAALARAPELWAAGVSIVGVADWQMEMELDEGGQPLPFRLKERLVLEELAYQSSANAHLERWRAPILFVSGDDDQAGWVQAAIQLGQSLRRRGIEVDALVEPGGTHGGWTHTQVSERVRRAFAFFDRHLKAAR
ncbi:prolyl oligopeptidase family serine peptidase [Steroidobacter sp.]|uniref:S9 family peptidase n=1 Tax=Steroidobacter sp. TaxID=1978227 RepID=UPI001A42D761|nr:prolyl oligopeptidase family serine peptidase [Steroidobacter sp.]MBL8269263.1 S9 family peptidase [Steroidobacter sp.]